MAHYGLWPPRFVFSGATKRRKIPSSDRSSFDDRSDLDKYRARDPEDSFLDGWTLCGFWKFDEQEAFSPTITFADQLTLEIAHGAKDILLERRSSTVTRRFHRTRFWNFSDFIPRFQNSLQSRLFGRSVSFTL